MISSRRSKSVPLLALLAIAFLLSASAGWAGSAESSETTSAPSVESVIYLVRHAEKIYPPPEDSPRDPRLNVMGQERAQALARLLSAHAVEQIFSTEYRRTRETAQDTSERLGLPILSYDPRQLEDFAARLRASGKRTLVVGHSNTTPQLVELLGGEPGEPIDEMVEFDRLYIVITRSDAPTQTIVLRYGKPVPENWRELADKRFEDDSPD